MTAGSIRLDEAEVRGELQAGSVSVADGMTIGPGGLTSFGPVAVPDGTLSADTLTDGTTNKAYTATEKTKLAGVATGATANSSDATLLARANHTGTQLAATISDFASAVLAVPLSYNTQTASYVLVLADAGLMVRMNVASGNTLTVPPQSSVVWVAGTVIHGRQVGTGQTTLTPGSGVTINSSTGLKSRTQYSTWTLERTATSDVWVAYGDLTA